jgi:hypothetical protein
LSKVLVSGLKDRLLWASEQLFATQERETLFKNYEAKQKLIFLKSPTAAFLSKCNNENRS